MILAVLHHSRHSLLVMTAMNESIMKTDRLGRLRYAPEQKAAIIEAYLTSGMSAPRFAALHGVNYQTLVSWLKKNKPAASVMRDAPAALFSLIPAEITHDIIPSTQALEVLLPSGAKLFISSQNQATLAAALMRELNPTSPC
jgi:Transposase